MAPARGRKRHRSKRLWAEGARKCYYCGCALTPSTISADHVKPISKGGYDKWSNIVPACRRCNGAKGSLSRDEFMNSR